MTEAAGKERGRSWLVGDRRAGEDSYRCQDAGHLQKLLRAGKLRAQGVRMNGLQDGVVPGDGEKVEGGSEGE